jgi:hypothetical protein
MKNKITSLTLCENVPSTCFVGVKPLDVCIVFFFTLELNKKTYSKVQIFYLEKKHATMPAPDTT